MAYLDLTSAFRVPEGAAAATAGTDAPAPWREQPVGRTDLSPLEWSVVAVARRDRYSSLRSPGPVARAMGSVFGIGRSSMLADPQLEALRRLAVHAWHRGYAVPPTEVSRFRKAGFSLGQLETVLASITQARHAGRRRAALH